MRRLCFVSIVRSLGAVALAVVALGGALGLPRADAAIACRSDPVVVLSNGIRVDLHVTLDRGASTTFQGIAYVLHGPPLPTAGTPPPGAVASGAGWYALSYPDGSGAYSSFAYVPDDNVGNYDADIVVSMPQSIPATAYMDWLAGSGAPTPTAPAQGHGDQQLHIHMHVAL